MGALQEKPYKTFWSSRGGRAENGRRADRGLWDAQRDAPQPLLGDPLRQRRGAAGRAGRPSRAGPGRAALPRRVPPIGSDLSAISHWRNKPPRHSMFIAKAAYFPHPRKRTNLWRFHSIKRLWQLYILGYIKWYRHVEIERGSTVKRTLKNIPVLNQSRNEYDERRRTSFWLVSQCNQSVGILCHIVWHKDMAIIRNKTEYLLMSEVTFPLYNPLKSWVGRTTIRSALGPVISMWSLKIQLEINLLWFPCDLSRSYALTAVLSPFNLHTLEDYSVSCS